MGARLGGLGTGTRRIADVKRLAEALKSAGIDPRHWCSYGTVAVVNDAGVPNVTDPHAIWIGPEGVEVDVLLEPLRIPVTAHYGGIMGGCSATIISPIKPGDQVLVILPEGDLMGPPVISCILHSASCPVPMGPDQKPLFKNDRVMVFSEDTPIEIRTKSGSKVTLTQDGKAQVEAALVELGAKDLLPTTGVVNGEGIDPFTGLTYFQLSNASAVVRAKKLP